MQQRKEFISRFKWKSMRTKLIGGMAAAALIPTISIAVISNVITKNIIHDEVSNSTLQVTKLANNSLDYNMNGVINQLQLLANNDNFKGFYSKRSNYVNINHLLAGTLKSANEYACVYFASTNKDMLIEPNLPFPEGYDPASRVWYKEAVKNDGQIYFSEPYEDAVTKKQVITLSRAVYDHKGQLVGVAAIDIFMDDFGKMINAIKIGKNGHMAIVGTDGKYIFHPDQKKIGSVISDKVPLGASMEKQNEGYVDYIEDGTEKFSAFTTNKQMGWRFVSTLNRAEINESANKIRNFGWILTAIFAIFSTIFAYFFGRRISLNIHEVKKALETASSGDFTTRVSVKANDEFKELEQSFNHTMEQLSTTLRNVEQSSKTVLETSSQLSVMTSETSASVSEVAVAIEEIAQGTSLQARNVTVSSEQMKELSQQLDEISVTTESMHNVSQRSMELSNKGLDQIDVLTSKSLETKNTTDEVSAIVKDIDRRMGEINSIIEAIAKITEQTNLLALNASIESARAGEHGRGFAVVAHEVRKLAEQSRASADEIKNIVDSIKAVVKNAVGAMEQTNQAVQEQDLAVIETKAIFTDILAAVRGLAQKVTEVQESINDSKENKDSISQEMGSIAGVSEQTAAATEEVSASADEISATMSSFEQYANSLTELSEKLDKEINKFIL